MEGLASAPQALLSEDRVVANSRVCEDGWSAESGMPPPDPITRLNAALEGRYRVEREIGEGGMATVYQSGVRTAMRRVSQLRQAPWPT